MSKDFGTALKAGGIRVTPQRTAVYRVFSAPDIHLSVEDVYEAVKKEISNISLATVYSILDTFTRIGVLSEVHIDGSRIYYELRKCGHHHFMCTVCGSIYDVEIPLCGTLKKGEIQGHKIETFQGYFYGTCSRCR